MALVLIRAAVWRVGPGGSRLSGSSCICHRNVVKCAKLNCYLTDMPQIKNKTLTATAVARRGQKRNIGKYIYIYIYIKWNDEIQNDHQLKSAQWVYIGLCDTSFKSRYRHHTCSFRNERYRNSTELIMSKYVWSLKDKKTDYQIRWRCIRHARSYSNVTKKCNLCLWEKYYIICRPNMATLNNRNELVSSCRHAKKFLLNNVII